MSISCLTLRYLTHEIDITSLPPVEPFPIKHKEAPNPLITPPANPKRISFAVTSPS